MGEAVQSIQRAFTLLEVLGNADEHLSFTEIARLSNLPLATTHRLLNTLTLLGYVEKNPETTKYTLGVRILQLRGAVIEQLNLGVQAMPVMKALMHRIGETVHLAVFDQGEIVYIERVEGLRTHGMYTRIGKRAPAHCTALGKTMIAFLPQNVWYHDVVERHGLNRFSDTTITTIDALCTELDRIRACGYAIDNGETGEAVRCLAAPIRDYTGQVIAAISVSGPQSQVTWSRVGELSESVCWAGDLISRKLGFSNGE